MPIRMNKPSESSFGINIDDRFDPSDDHVVKLDDMDEYQGISKVDGKPYTSIKWVFTVYDAEGVAFTNLIDGGVYETWQFSSQSLAPKSNGRAWAAALLGKIELTDEECDRIAENFDTALIGKQARASWKVETDPTTKNKRLKIAMLRPMRMRQAPVGATRPPEPEVAPSAPPPSAPTTNGARETAAEKRARLHAELAAMSDAEDAEDGDVPF
jgi:hypothetical protein